MKHTEEFEELLYLYALGVLEGEELRTFEDHLGTGCEICKQSIADSELALTAMAHAADDASPLSPGIRHKILETIDEQEITLDRHPILLFWKNIRPMWFNLGAAVAVMLIALLLVDNMDMRDKMSRQGAEIVELRAKLSSDEMMENFIMSPNVNLINLIGVMSESDASGKLLWDRDTNHAFLMVSNIPALKQGKTYQFWVVEDGEPHSMGVFEVDNKGANMIEIKCMPKPERTKEFFVTLEPEGGMPYPTGARYLLGSL